MIRGLLGLLACQLAGELLVTVTEAPLPGAVVGLALLFVILQVRGTGEDSSVVRTGSTLLTHLQLLFVPAGVGVVVYLGVLADQAWPILVGLAGSWALGLLSVAYVASALARLSGGSGEPDHG